MLGEFFFAVYCLRYVLLLVAVLLAIALILTRPRKK